MALSPADRTLVRLSVAIVLGRWDELRALREAGTPDRRWREAVLQTHLFAGFPRLVEAFNVLSQCGGLGSPDAAETAHPASEAADFERGLDLFGAIYADQASDVRGVLAAAHPEVERWVLGHAYGRVLARPGLEPAFRELLATACLAATAQDRQLASHVRGAQRLGQPAEDLSAALDEVADLIEPGVLAKARSVLERFRLPIA